MRVLRRLPARPPGWKRVVAAIGIFDGVHRGHRAILAKAVQRSRAVRGTAAAVTFYPHPLAVLAPRFLPKLLISLPRRLKGFAALGIRAAFVIPFRRSFCRLSPRVFVKRYLVKTLQVKEVVVGHDFRFGAGRSGSARTLRELGDELGFRVHVVGPVKVRGQRAASHRIRKLIARGALKKAGSFLGRPATIEGRVKAGSGRGRKLGFPTANLKVEAGVLPPVGVYAICARVGERAYPGMANVGYRPTFKKSTAGVLRRRGLTPMVENHLFGLKGSVYGRRMVTAFLKRLRPERRFPSAGALARQLKRDARQARQAIRQLRPPGFSLDSFGRAW
ncbi:MAG: riboflavin biosynthesis protein RibF [Candidatus Omnitrophica bacterium]|nr:riboflavin biosynthesis protein RibF [Candidatus Omnitrophota bacterium]